MVFRTIVGFLIVLIAFSCSQETKKGGQLIDSGLLIDNGINRGVSYTDSIGTKYNVRYIPITITNDSTIRIRIQIAFSKEYHYPIELGAEKFIVFLMPKELPPDNVTFDSMSYELGDNELRNYFDRGLNPPNVLIETIEPGKKYVTAIGTLYPSFKDCYVLPNALFAQGDSINFQVCDNTIDQDGSTNPQLSLGLKLDFNRGEANESCRIISCGHISYLEN